MKPLMMLEQINYPKNKNDWGNYELIFTSHVIDESEPIKVLISNVVKWEFIYGNSRCAKSEKGHRQCYFSYSTNKGGDFLTVINPDNSLISFCLELMKKYKCGGKS